MEHPDTDWGGRLPLLDPADTDVDQRRLDERLRATTAVTWRPSRSTRR